MLVTVTDSDRTLLRLSLSPLRLTNGKHSAGIGPPVDPFANVKPERYGGSARFDHTRELARHFCAMRAGDDADEKPARNPSPRPLNRFHAHSEVLVENSNSPLRMAEDTPTKCNFKNQGSESVRYTGLV